MAMPDAYSLKTNSISKYFQALLALPVPEVFDAAFFSDIGFRYAIDRSFIDILKELHFLDADGRPTRRYFDFHDGIAASDALLDGIREAYGRLLETAPDACAQPQKQIFETLKTLYAGSKPDMMVLGIAKTFVALCQYAEEIDRNPPPLHAAMEVQVKEAGQGEPEGTPEPAAPGVPRDLPETTASTVPIDATAEPVLLARPEPAAAPQAPTLTAAPTDARGLAGDIQERFVLPPLVLDEDTPPLVQATGTVEDGGMPEDAMAPAPAPEPAAQGPQAPQSAEPAEPIVTAEPAPPIPDARAPETVAQATSAAFSPETPPASDHVLKDLPEAPPREPDPVPAAAKRLSIRGTNAVDGPSQTVNFVLPETRDPAVYEAIFASFKRQLLKPE
ncbi:DUF5343 domain-containing protein [Desulfovibrio sp. JY]|nr:DUF5343 domain-containing protein [Desulfovibrio sp. JY]